MYRVPSASANSCRWERSQRAKARSIASASSASVCRGPAIITRAGGCSSTRSRPESSSSLIESHRSLATATLRCGPPVGPLALRGEKLERCRDPLGVDARSAEEAELPQLASGFRVAVDYLVDAMNVELAGVVALDRVGNVRDETREFGLVIGRDQRLRDPPLLL